MSSMVTVVQGEAINYALVREIWQVQEQLKALRATIARLQQDLREARARLEQTGLTTWDEHAAVLRRMVIEEQQLRERLRTH